MAHIKIFVIDDDKEFLEEIKEMLSLSGYSVFVACGGEGILNKIDEFQPDVLLLDLKMIPKSGFQIADEIGNFPQWCNLIIIAMSGYFKEKEHQPFGNACGIRSFLTKPIYPVNLISQIELQLSRSRTDELFFPGIKI